MLSYLGIHLLFNKCIKLFENIKTKILNYRRNLIKIKDNYIEKISEIKFSIYNKYLVIKDITKTNFKIFFLKNWQKSPKFRTFLMLLSFMGSQSSNKKWRTQRFW